MKKKIGLMGFGKAGQAVASVILANKEFSLEWVYRRDNSLKYDTVAEYLGVKSDEPGIIYSQTDISIDNVLENHKVDFIVDFSSNKGIMTYGKLASEKGIKIISAISHYTDKEISYLKLLAQKTTVFWSPNITLGVNYLLFVSKFLKNIAPWADIELIEEHFKQKEGVSGTAIKIAEALNIDDSNINSIRAGGIVGKHEIIFGFPFQTVRLIHESISREAFGNGAILAAKNLINKTKGFYNFEDLLKPYFNINEDTESSAVNV